MSIICVYHTYKTNIMAVFSLKYIKQCSSHTHEINHHDPLVIAEQTSVHLLIVNEQLKRIKEINRILFFLTMVDDIAVSASSN